MFRDKKKGWCFWSHSVWKQSMFTVYRMTLFADFCNAALAWERSKHKRKVEMCFGSEKWISSLCKYDAVFIYGISDLQTHEAKSWSCWRQSHNSPLTLTEPKIGMAHFNSVKFHTARENLTGMTVFTTQVFYIPKSLMWRVCVSSPWKHL